MTTATTSPPVSVKMVGSNGRIALGKQYAGRQVLVEEQEAGFWLIRTATVVPDNERWLHAPSAASDLSNALSWALQNAPDDAALNATLTRLSNNQQ